MPNQQTYFSFTNKNVGVLWFELEDISQQGAQYVINGSDQRTAVGALLSNRYFIAEDGTKTPVPYGYTAVGSLDKYMSGKAVTADNDKGDSDRGSKPMTVYENKYALPWGYTFDSATSYAAVEHLNGLEKQEVMLRHVVLDDPDASGVEAEYVDALPIEQLAYTVTNAENASWKDGILEITKDNGSLTLEFDMPGSVEGYVRLEGFEIDETGPKEVTVTTESGNVKKSAAVKSPAYVWYYGRKNYLFNLGYSKDGRTSCKVTIQKKGTYSLGNIQVYALHMDSYADCIENLRAEPLENISCGSNIISGTVDVSNDKVLCLSVPYGAGWSATVDGKPVQIMRANYMFMAVPVSAGYHEVEFRYFTPGLKTGLEVMLAGLVILALMIHRDLKNRQGGNAA